MKGIAAVALCIVAVMIAIKDGRVLHSAGLTGSCSRVTATAGADYEACKAGKLEGRPDLTKRGCKPAGMKGTLEYWRCPSGTQPEDH